MPEAVAGAKRALKKAYLQMKSAAIVDRGGDVGRAVFLAGGARSGTTWLSELVNYDNAYRFVFEPFGVKQFGDFWYGSYVRPDDADPRLRDLAQAVFSGRFHDPWSDQFNRRMVADRRLVKEVRANLWIKWLRVQFPQIPVIFVMRHPVPTVWSRYRRYFEAKNREAVDTDPQARTEEYLQYLLGQPALVEDHLGPMREAIAQASTVWDQRMFVWCVQNYVPLRQAIAGDAYVVFYENVCMDPEGELRRLFAFLGREADDSFVRRLWKPSPMARQREMPDPKTLVEGWRRRVPAPEVDRAIEILRIFGLDAVYGAEPMPRTAGLAAFGTASAPR
jgi:hypothetical protein